MKHIVIPTDFSEPALSAAVFGFSLAQDLGAQVTLLHAWHIPPVPENAPSDLESRVETESSQQLADFDTRVIQMMEKQGRKFTGKKNLISREGFAVDEILGTAQETGGFIVMGTHGATGLAGILLGSNTSTVIQRGEAPVIAVPPHCVYNGMKHVAYATDWREEDNSSLAALIKMLSPLHPLLELVHIMDEGETLDFVDDENLERAFPALTGNKNATFRHLRASDPVHGLKAYMEGEKPDLLVMTTHKRGFFGRIFNPSVTQKMANVTQVPLLALHG